MSITKRFTQFVLQGRMQAIGMALLFAFVPFLSWMTAVIVGLVTLCKGATEGFVVLLWSTLPYIVLAAMNTWFPLLNSVLCGSLLIWLLAILLRRYASWERVLEWSTLIATVIVLLITLFVPNLQAWWSAKMMEAVQLIAKMAQVSIDMQQMKLVLPVVAPFATGVEAAFVLFAAWSSLLVARVFQSQISHRVHWRGEWLNLRLHYTASAFLLLAVILIGFNVTVVKYLLPVALLPFLIAGFSVLHAVLVSRKVATYWVLLLYLLIAVGIAAFPQILVLFIVIAILDTIINFRLRFARYARS